MNRTKVTHRIKLGNVMLLGLLLCAMVALLAMATNAYAKDSGWANDGSSKVYYKGGEKVTGIQKIEKAYYCFDGKGKLKTGISKVGSRTIYANDQGQMEAYKIGSVFYKPTGKKMSKNIAQDYKALLNARKVVKQVTSKSDSKDEKKLKCFKWVTKGNYHIYREFKLVKGWASNYANDHFVRRINGYRYGDCVSDPCAFAFLCAAIGYSDVSVGTGQVKHAHGTTRVNGKYYDPLFAEAKGFSTYYGHADKYWVTACNVSIPNFKNNYTVCSYVGKVKPAGLNVKDEVSDKNGLLKIDGSYYFYENGKKVKSKWITVGKHTYYFKSSGKAAVGSTKARKDGKSSFYVFDVNGKLLAGKKSRVVKVRNVSYRVAKTGKALKGWQSTSKGKKYLYTDNGARVTGPVIYKKKLYVFGANGVLNASKTSDARKLASYAVECSELVKFLGKAKKTSTNNSCMTLPGTDDEGNSTQMSGTDKTYTYQNMTLCTFVADGVNGDGKEYFVLAY